MNTASKWNKSAKYLIGKNKESALSLSAHHLTKEWKVGPGATRSGSAAHQGLCSTLSSGSLSVTSAEQSFNKGGLRTAGTKLSDNVK